MTQGYEPPSDFLKMMLADEIALTGSVFADANLQRLIALTTDGDRANRDWATMMLAWSEIDNEAVRSALLAAAEDVDPVVRAEAIYGVALRAPEQALALVYRELKNDVAYPPIMEAAALVGDAILIDHVRPFAEGDEWVAELARDAIEACSRNRD